MIKWEFLERPSLYFSTHCHYLKYFIPANNSSNVIYFKVLRIHTDTHMSSYYNKWIFLFAFPLFFLVHTNCVHYEDLKKKRKYWKGMRLKWWMGVYWETKRTKEVDRVSGGKIHVHTLHHEEVCVHRSTTETYWRQIALYWCYRYM